MPSTPGTGAQPVPDAAPGHEVVRTVVRVSPWSIVRATVLVAGLALLLWMVEAASTTLWWIAIAATIAGLALPLVNRLDRRMPRGLAIAIVLLAVFVLGGLLVGRVLVEVNLQIGSVRQTWIDSAREMERSSGVGKVATEFDLAGKVESLFSALPVYLGGGDTSQALSAVSSAAGSLVVIGFFILLLIISGRRFYRAGLDQLRDPAAAQRIRTVVSAAYRSTTGYLGWMIGRAILFGAVAALLALVLGYDSPTVVGLWFAAWSLVPGLGLVIAALPLAVGLSLSSLPLGASVLVLATAVQVADGRTLLRQLEHRTLIVGPALTLLAAVFGLFLYGFGGFVVLLAGTTFVVALLQEVQGLGPDLMSAVRYLRTGERVAGVDELVSGSAPAGPGGTVDGATEAGGEVHPRPAG